MQEKNEPGRDSGLVLLGVFTSLVQGYHLGVDDSAIYIPAIKGFLNPSLYPYGAEYFEGHARLSFFPVLVGTFARMLHIQADTAVLLWYVLCNVLMMYAVWRIMRLCFRPLSACWGGVMITAAALTTPIAGTGLFLMDPYVTGRSLSTPAILFAIGFALKRRWSFTILWLLLACSVHPHMGIFAILFIALITLLPQSAQGRTSRKAHAGQAVLASALPGGFNFDPVSPAYLETLESRSFFFLQRWAWYEWIGVAGPFLIVASFLRLRSPQIKPTFYHLCKSILLFGGLATLAGVVLSSSPLFINFVRLQPMRAFHIFYCIFVPFMGAVLTIYVFQKRLWTGVAAFAALSILVGWIQVMAYPNSPHIELPGASGSSPWVAAFEWIRGNTPVNAVFALPPDYMARAKDDQHGFRAVAERSALPDLIKDSGPVSLFPQMVDEWKKQTQSQAGWNTFTAADYQRLAQEYPVSWIVIDRAPPQGFNCPYNNQSVHVCQIPGARGL